MARYQTHRQKPSGITDAERQQVREIMERNWHRKKPQQAEQEIKDLIDRIKYRDQD